MQSHLRHLLFINLLLCLLACHKGYTQEGYYLGMKEALKEPEKVKYLTLGEIKELNEEITLFKNLKVLYIRISNLSFITPKIAELDSLKEIRFLHSKVKNGLPREIVNAPQLTLIKLSSSWINYPKELKNHPRIKIVDGMRTFSPGLLVGAQRNTFEIGLLWAKVIYYQSWLPKFSSISFSWEKNIKEALSGFKFSVGNELFNLSTIYYIDTSRKQTGWAFRPEIGVGILSIHLRAGYNFMRQKVDLAPRFLLSFRAGFEFFTTNAPRYY